MSSRSAILKSFMAAILVVVLSSCGSDGEKIEADKIRATFQSYLTKSLEKRGAEVVALADKESVQFFGKILNLALHGNQTELSSLRTLDKELALNARHQIGTNLLGLTPESFMAYGVDNGWVNAGSVAGLKVGKVSIVGNSATGEVLLGEKQTGFSVEFRKENDAWKISLNSFMPAGNEALRKMITSSGLTEDQYIFNLIESGSGKKVSETIWNPIAEVTK